MKIRTLLCINIIWIVDWKDAMLLKCSYISYFMVDRCLDNKLVNIYLLQLKSLNSQSFFNWYFLFVVSKVFLRIVFACLLLKPKRFKAQLLELLLQYVIWLTFSNGICKLRKMNLSTYETFLITGTDKYGFEISRRKLF